MSVSDSDESIVLIEVNELVCAGEITGNSSECAQELKFLHSVLKELRNQRQPEEFRREWDVMTIEETSSYGANIRNLILYRDSCRSFTNCSCPENSWLVNWLVDNFTDELNLTTSQLLYNP